MHLTKKAGLYKTFNLLAVKMFFRLAVFISLAKDFLCYCCCYIVGAMYQEQLLIAENLSSQL